MKAARGCADVSVVRLPAVSRGLVATAKNGSS